MDGTFPQGSNPATHGFDPREDYDASGWSSGDHCSTSAAEHPIFHRLVLWLWFLFLFEPTRLISFYIPPLSPIKWIPELMLYATMVLWLFSPAPKRHIKWFTVFFGLTLFGTVIAFIFGNWGVARLIVRMMFSIMPSGS